MAAATSFSSGIGAFTFHAHQHGADECDSRGLPLTPNSIIMTGNFQQLKTMSHPNICQYLDLVKSPSEERLMCVSEYYQDCIEDHITTGHYSSVSSIGRIAYEVLSGLSYLHKRNICVRNLSPSNILLTNDGQVKLFNYGFFHMTSNGEAVDFPIGYLAPEIILAKKAGKHESTPIATKSDVWSFGIIMLELVMQSHIYPELFLKNGLTTLFARIIQLVRNEQRNSIHPLQTLLETHSQNSSSIDSRVLAILEDCLHCLPSKRRSVSELLDVPFINEYKIIPNFTARRDPFKRNGFRASTLKEPTPCAVSTLEEAKAILERDHLSSWDIKDVYFLWCLAGGDVRAELSKHGLIKSRTPILNLPMVVSREGSEFGADKTAVNLFDDKTICLPLNQLKSRLESMRVEDFYPILKDPEAIDNSCKQSLSEGLEAAKLPLAIKEMDVEYQFHRVVLYRQLLEGYPYTREMIINEALTDICPHYRGAIWAALLNVKGDILTQYTSIDKDTETPTDRQIAVDIPRCHQYDFLLASRQGHLKFKRVLKAWVASHTDLVYWQGLDSLCAPFISLNFDNEALAYACLSAFIDKFLKDFFQHKNSELMQEYLAVYSHMIAFHDPELYSHLDRNMFYPDLYAIPWFLTMFTHVFPLSKIYHLWDTLLLGNPSFPLFAGLSILSHLRTELFSTSDFSECITMFSDLPDIDIQQCTQDAIAKYQMTPPSLCVRDYDSQPIEHPLIPEKTRKSALEVIRLKENCSPEISAHDLISLCHLKGINEYRGLGEIPIKDPSNPLLWRQLGNTPTKSMEAVLIDMRSDEEFRVERVPNSLNIPMDKEKLASGVPILPEATAKLLEEKHKGKVIIIIADNKKYDKKYIEKEKKKDEWKRNDTLFQTEKENYEIAIRLAHAFARQLVESHFRYVCVLQGGAGLLKSLGLFVTQTVI